jgi:hypothetical protein
MTDLDRTPEEAREQLFTTLERVYDEVGDRLLLIVYDGMRKHGYTAAQIQNLTGWRVTKVTS